MVYCSFTANVGKSKVNIHAHQELLKIELKGKRQSYIKPVNL